MIDYFILSAELSLVGIVAFACLRTAPARWRLWTSATVLVLAVFPWSALPPIPVSAGSPATPALDALPLVPTSASTEFLWMPVIEASTSWEVTLFTILSVSFTVGLAAFTLLEVRQQASLRKWRQFARDGSHLLDGLPKQMRTKCEVRILPGSSCAAATGVLNPTVWIGERHLDDPRLESVLLHELTSVATTLCSRHCYHSCGACSGCSPWRGCGSGWRGGN